MVQTKKLQEDFVHLARLALSGRPQDVQVFIYRVAKKTRKDAPEFSESLSSLLSEAPTRSTPLRRQTGDPLPVDAESRLQLVRLEHVNELSVTPIFEGRTKALLDQLSKERLDVERLAARGLSPTRSALFVGPPGVGKTLAARWMAREIGKPLLILDLSAVMSSFLGRTGNNLRQVLDYAKSEDCILFLDEIDAVAKRRDDSTEIGELKRLVTVLLQEVDDWPETGLLLAAINHPDLLDPAAWRRFEIVVDFPMPNHDQVRAAIERFLDGDGGVSDEWKGILARLLTKNSFSDIERNVLAARRAAVVNGQPITAQLEQIAISQIGSIDHPSRIALAKDLLNDGLVSQRRASEITGVSRDTLRKVTDPNNQKRGRRREKKPAEVTIG